MHSSFRSIVALEPSSSPLFYRESILALGSCFVEHLQGYLSERAYRLYCNPLGISYNPASLARGMRLLCSSEEIAEQELFAQGDLYVSLQHHGSFSRTSVGEALAAMNGHLQRGRELLQEADVLVLTLGTAWVYEHKASGQIVNNCQRLPASEFRRRRLSVSEIVEQLRQAILLLRQQRPQLRCICTVSPIRHAKDGFVENQRSKASLHLALDELEQSLPALSYFPAYELLLDDLRDYRFYAEDMFHPSAQAVQYIFSNFEGAFLAPQEAHIRQAVQKLFQSFLHRPLHANTAAYREFVATRQERFENYQKTWPGLDWRGFAEALQQRGIALEGLL